MDCLYVVQYWYCTVVRQLTLSYCTVHKHVATVIPSLSALVMPWMPYQIIPTRNCNLHRYCFFSKWLHVKLWTPQICQLSRNCLNGKSQLHSQAETSASRFHSNEAEYRESETQYRDWVWKVYLSRCEGMKTTPNNILKLHLFIYIYSFTFYIHSSMNKCKLDSLIKQLQWGHILRAATVLIIYGDLWGFGSVMTPNKKTCVQISVKGWHNYPKQYFEV